MTAVDTALSRCYAAASRLHGSSRRRFHLALLLSLATSLASAWLTGHQLASVQAGGGLGHAWLLCLLGGLSIGAHLAAATLLTAKIAGQPEQAAAWMISGASLAVMGLVGLVAGEASKPAVALLLSVLLLGLAVYGRALVGKR